MKLVHVCQVWAFRILHINCKGILIEHLKDINERFGPVEILINYKILMKEHGMAASDSPELGLVLPKLSGLLYASHYHHHYYYGELVTDNILNQKEGYNIKL